MKKNLSNLLAYLISLSLCLIGISVVYYGFERVSVPNVHEYNVGWMIILGLILAVVGIGVGIVKIGRSRRPRHAPQPVDPKEV